MIQQVQSEHDQGGRARLVGSVDTRVVRLVKSHHAKFDQKHNASKLCALMVLHVDKLRGGKGLHLGEWHEKSHVSYKYLSKVAKNWEKWGYIHRKPSKGSAGPCYVYSIKGGGIQILRYCKNDYPHIFDHFRSELGY